MRTITEPQVKEGAVLFTIIAENRERDCIVSKNALAFLAQLHGKTNDALSIYMAYEPQIHKVAKRLVLAGENASPLILGAGYFIDLSVSNRS